MSHVVRTGGPRRRDGRPGGVHRADEPRDRRLDAGVERAGATEAERPVRGEAVGDPGDGHRVARLLAHDGAVGAHLARPAQPAVGAAGAPDRRRVDGADDRAGREVEDRRAGAARPDVGTVVPDRRPPPPLALDEADRVALDRAGPQAEEPLLLRDVHERHPDRRRDVDDRGPGRRDGRGEPERPDAPVRERTEGRVEADEGEVRPLHRRPRDRGRLGDRSVGGGREVVEPHRERGGGRVLRDDDLVRVPEAHAVPVRQDPGGRGASRVPGRGLDEGGRARRRSVEAADAAVRVVAAVLVLQEDRRLRRVARV